MLLTSRAELHCSSNNNLPKARTRWVGDFRGIKQQKCNSISSALETYSSLSSCSTLLSCFFRSFPFRPTFGRTIYYFHFFSITFLRKAGEYSTTRVAILWRSKSTKSIFAYKQWVYSQRITVQGNGVVKQHWEEEVYILRLVKSITARFLRWKIKSGTSEAKKAEKRYFMHLTMSSWKSFSSNCEICKRMSPVDRMIMCGVLLLLCSF